MVSNAMFALVVRGTLAPNGTVVIRVSEIYLWPKCRPSALRTAVGGMRLRRV
ncbi:protein of unknown function [Candidatus Hydrogenisulfobacillus filiaventi]|uniref:Uncharacterized protein n=1 Tax=Candidatus Hydrogenisulfobacillus filiaventi TaxID=2707344 RepID=A0A6F8ZI62_9FIRM|nr:protein of unknown function [Candidatus Hydrogenisulfobacillus filiaventi]